VISVGYKANFREAQSRDFNEGLEFNKDVLHRQLADHALPLRDPRLVFLPVPIAGQATVTAKNLISSFFSLTSLSIRYSISNR